MIMTNNIATSERTELAFPLCIVHIFDLVLAFTGICFAFSTVIHNLYTL